MYYLYHVYDAYDMVCMMRSGSYDLKVICTRGSSGR